MRSSVTAAAVAGLLSLTACSTPAEPAAPEPPATAPSASPEPAVRFTAPAKVGTLPRTTQKKWTKTAESATESLERQVLRPLDTLAAVYVDTGDPAEGVAVSAVAGRVADPAVQLTLLTRSLADQWQDERPAELAVDGGVGSCRVNRAERPLVRTLCHWAEPGSVGQVSLWGLKDRRKDFPGVHALIQPAG